MKVHIITIGDEILIGQIDDTNSAWMSAQLNDIGVSVERKITVGDSDKEIKSAVNESLALADIVIITGGLGPTKDDITKQCLSEIFNSPLVRDMATYRRVEKILGKWEIEFNELNKNQALVPQCCQVLTNHNGTAPGMWFEREGKILVSLPGVPFEMKPIMTKSVLPLLQEKFKLRSVVHRTVITFGLAESILAQTIEKWESELPSFLHLAYLPNPLQIRIRLSAYDVDKELANEEIERQFVMLEKIIPEYIIGYGDDTVATVTARILTERKLTLSVAESCTGGVLSAKFTAIAGASKYFMGSVISYSNDIKRDVLGIDDEIIEKYGAVSQEVAELMAVGVKRVCKTDYAIATTGIAGPTGGTPQKPVGTVWITVVTPDKIVSEKMMLGNLREQNIEKTTSLAINLLRQLLLEQENAKTSQGIL